jgi:hypothetical protein
MARGHPIARGHHSKACHVYEAAAVGGDEWWGWDHGKRGSMEEENGEIEAGSVGMDFGF